MPRPKKYEKDPHKFSELKRDIPLEASSALPKSRHYAAAFAAIVIVVILIYLKLFNHT